MNTQNRFHALIKSMIATIIAALCLLTATSAFAQSDPCFDESTRELAWRDGGTMHCSDRTSDHVEHEQVYNEPSIMDTHGQVIGGVAGGALGVSLGLVTGVILAMSVDSDPLGVSAGIPLLGMVGGGYFGAFVGSSLGHGMSNVQRAPKGVAQPTGFNFKLSF